MLVEYIERCNEELVRILLFITCEMTRVSPDKM